MLKTEVTTDPLGRGYSTMTDLEVANDLNTVYRTRNKTSLSGSEILNAVVPAEWTALTTEEQRTVWDVVHINGTINPFGIEATLLIGVFGAGSDTIAALAAARIEAISRATELGVGTVRAGDINEAMITAGVR